MEGHGFLSEVDEGSRDYRVVGDKVSIKSHEPKEGSYIAHILGLWPVFNAFDLGGVHLYGTVFQYNVIVGCAMA